MQSNDETFMFKGKDNYARTKANFKVSLASGASLLGCERRSRERSTSKDFFESLLKNLGFVVNLVLESNEQHYNLTIRRICKFIPPPWYKRGEGVGAPPPPLGF